MTFEVRHIAVLEYDVAENALELPEPKDGEEYRTVCGTPRFMTFRADRNTDDVHYCGECVQYSLKAYKRNVLELEIVRTTVNQMIAASQAGAEVLKLHRKLWTAEDVS